MVAGQRRARLVWLLKALIINGLDEIGPLELLYYINHGLLTLIIRIVFWRLNWCSTKKIQIMRSIAKVYGPVSYFEHSSGHNGYRPHDRLSVSMAIASVHASKMLRSKTRIDWLLYKPHSKLCSKHPSRWLDSKSITKISTRAFVYRRSTLHVHACNFIGLRTKCTGNARRNRIFSGRMRMRLWSTRTHLLVASMEPVDWFLLFSRFLIVVLTW